jgi:hypothetical protein
MPSLERDKYPAEQLEWLDKTNRLPQEDIPSIKLEEELVKEEPEQEARSYKVGLRYLSEKVMDIVVSQSQTSYREVAQQLVADHRKKEDESKERCKEEQNIRRRVYDALNVLVAGGIILKAGKNILSRKPLAIGKRISAGWPAFSKVRRELEKEREVLAKKKALLRQHQLRLEALTQVHAKQGPFRSPLLFVRVNFETGRSKVLLLKDARGERLRITSKDRIEVLGELDLIFKRVEAQGPAEDKRAP